MRIFGLALLAALSLPVTASAHSSHAGDIAIGHTWAKPKVDADENLLVKLPLLNNGKEADALTSVEAEGAQGVRMSVGTAEMDKVALAPGKPVPVTLTLLGLKIVKAGDHIPLVLHFGNAPDGKISVHVEDKPGH